MLRVLSIFQVVLFAYLTSTTISFEVSQVQYQYLSSGKLNPGVILDKFEDMHFLICTQKCRKDSECTGIALGHLKENRDDHKRKCYLLKHVDESELYCTADECDSEEVQIYQLMEPPTTTTPATTSITTEEATDEITTEEISECNGDLVILECMENRERNVIQVIKTYYNGQRISFDLICSEPFKQREISSSETVLRPVMLQQKTSCDSDEIFAGFEVCLTKDYGYFQYANIKCKKLLEGFVLKIDENQESITNEDEPYEVRCPEEQFIVTLKIYLKSSKVYASSDCGTLQSNVVVPNVLP